MARNSQSPSQTLSTTFTLHLLLLHLLLFTASSLASLPVQTLSEVPQGCSFHPQEKLVSCRGVNATLLQEFLLGLTSPPLPPEATNVTTTAPHTNTTTTTPRTPNINTTITSPHAAPTSTTTSTSSSSSNQEASGEVTELTCVGCQIPKLEATLFNPNASSITLQRLSIIDSGLHEVLHDALTSYTHTLVHLDLSYNLLNTIPKAALSLVRLQVVDLRHNGIHRVDGGPVLTSRSSLRYMYLDHNQLGQTVGKGEKSVFDLWNVDHTSMLPRLTHLGLSFNDIKDIPSGAFRRLTNLLHLDLSHNLLTSLHHDDLPSSLLNLDLAGNPWNCTCEAAWILKQRSNPPLLATTAASVLSTSIISPTCFSPLHLRRRHLDSLTVPALCPSEETSSNDEVVYIGDDVEGPLKDAFKSLRLLNATSLTTHALLVSWRIDAAFYSLSTSSLQPLSPLSWAVTVRDVTQNSREAHVTRLRLDRYRTEQPQWVPGNGLFAEVLDGLDTGKTYVICLTVMQRRRLYTRPGHCLHGTTLSTPPLSPVATTPESLQSYSSPDYNIRTEAFMVRSESRTASLSWNVTVLPRKGRSIALGSSENLLLQPLGWRVSYRRAGEDGNGDGEGEEVVLVSHGGEPLQNFTNSYSIEGLQAGTRYVFCLHTLTDKEVRESLTENNKKPLQDESSRQSISSLPWEEHSHTLPTTPRGKSIINSGSGVDSQHLESKTDDLPPLLPSPHTSKTTAQTDTLPDDHTPAPSSTNSLPFNVPVNPSRRGFPSQPPSGSFSNVPPIPPSLPPLPHNRPPRPPRPQSGGGFVYTSSGKKIPLPSGPSGLVPPFGVPPPVLVRDAGPPRDFPSPSVPQPPSPSRQRFIYEFDEKPKVPPPQLSSGSRQQIYTYQTRRRRSAEEHRLSSIHAVPLCQEVVTPVELDVVLPAAIAATMSCAATVVVVLVVCCCCWPRRCCQRKGAWRSRSIRSAYDSRKVSTISSPTIGTVLSGHTSGVTGPGTTLNEGNAAISRGQSLEDANKAGRSISTTSSSGYLTPMHSQDDRGPNSQSSDPKAAYLSLMQSRLLQRHKDLPEFHPGYDIPPTASNKSLVGYDYPNPTPVNFDGGNDHGSRVSATSLPPQLPSPSSSDSNYNVLVGNNSEHKSPTEVNLNLPFQQPKSSGLSKSVQILPDVTDNSNYIYPKGQAPTATTATRTYLKHPPPAKAKNRHRKFGQSQRGAEEHTGIIQSLSRSTPDLVTPTTTTEESRSMPFNLSSRDATSHTLTSSSQPASLTIADRTEDSTNYINLPAVQKDPEMNRQTVTSSSTGNNNSKDREPFHTWGGHQAKVRPGMGEVVLSGGTLIEVPDGYVVPKSPQPTPFIRLLVRGQDEPKDHSPNKPPQSSSVQETNSPSQGTTCRPIPDTHHNRLVINTAVAL